MYYSLVSYESLMAIGESMLMRCAQTAAKYIYYMLNLTIDVNMMLSNNIFNFI